MLYNEREEELWIASIGTAACELASPAKEVDAQAAHLAAESLLDLPHRTYWSTWREHLNKNYPEPERTAAPDRSRFRFRMNLLRDWWQRYVAPPPMESPAHG